MSAGHFLSIVFAFVIIFTVPLATIGGFGHSFQIEVDPESADYKQTFGWDGDGADRIDDIKIDGKKAEFE